MRSPGLTRLATVVGVLLLGVIVPLNTGCATANWTGKSIDDAIAKLGQPDRIRSLPDGRRVFTWHRSGLIPEEPTSDDRGRFRPAGPGTYWESWLQLVVDPDGIVLSSSEGQPTPPDLPPAQAPKT
jgi:hypothetical protein